MTVEITVVLVKQFHLVQLVLASGKLFHRVIVYYFNLIMDVVEKLIVMLPEVTLIVRRREVVHVV